MSWLARLDVDAESIYSEGIANDIYTWHKMLWQCYPDAPDRGRTDIGFLTRIDQFEGAYRFWVMSKEKPVRPQWCPSDGFAVNEISSSFLSHRYYAFDLKANPVKSAVRKDSNGEILLQSNGRWKRGKKVPIVKSNELKHWLTQKGKVRAVICKKNDPRIELPGGFKIIESENRPLEIRPMVESHFRKKDKKNNKEYAAYHGGVQFRGILEVTDQKAFTETYYSGVGSAKGFGFGMLLLAPVKL